MQVVKDLMNLEMLCLIKSISKNWLTFRIVPIVFLGSMLQVDYAIFCGLSIIAEIVMFQTWKKDKS